LKLIQKIEMKNFGFWTLDFDIVSAASLKKETIFNTFFHRSVTVVVNYIPINRATSQGDDKRLNDKDTTHTTRV
jgi:hypothetical protein